MRICQNSLLDKFMRLLFMRSSTLCKVIYGAIKIYAGQIYATRYGLAHIICINKTHAEKCRFTVLKWHPSQGM